jgi:hypothetical protein
MRNGMPSQEANRLIPEPKPWMLGQSSPKKDNDNFVPKPFNSGSHAPLKGQAQIIPQVNSPRKEPMQPIVS